MSSVQLKGHSGGLRLLTLWLPLAFFLIFILFPFFWTVVTAFKSNVEINARPMTYLPQSPSFENFQTAWEGVGFSIFFLNSMFLSVVSVAFITLISVMVGYALSRYLFRGKQLFLVMLLCTQFIPGAMLIIPLFLIFKDLHLINTLASLVIVYVTFHLPFSAILIRGFVSTIPVTLEEAAMIDGCGRFRAVTVAVLPLLAPGMVASSAFAFVGCWNEFLYALMFISKKALFTLPVGLRYMVGEYGVDYGALAAGSLIVLVPAVILFAFVQRYMVSGLSSGAVKG